MKRLHSIIATTAAASLFLILFAPPATAQLDKFNYRLIPSTELTASASDTSYPAYPPANAVDGNVNSCARINDAPPGQWFQLDAGHIRMLAGMEIYSSNYRIQDYEIYVSDEADPIDWGTPVASGTLPNTTAWHPITFAPAYGRYLRLAVLSRYSAVTTYIYEVRLYESQFQLASLVTGHTGYANSNMVAIAAMPAMTGYDAYQVSDSADEPADGWLPYDPDDLPIGVEVALGTPAEGESVILYAWFKDEANGIAPTTNAPATITYVRDSADVTASALDNFAVPSWGAAAPADIRVPHIDDNSHSSIGLHSVTISVVGDILPDDPARVRLIDAGSYTLTLTAIDNAGNSDSAICDLTVFAGTTGLTTAWTGGGDGSDWHDNANWSNYAPAPAGLAFITNSATVALKADSAALASIVVSNNATITFSNWNTTLSADDVTIGDKGTLTCVGPFRNEEMSNNVVIVCNTLQVDSSGIIDVAGKGYAGAVVGDSGGHGPGASLNSDNATGGGGHGGRGGQGGHTSQAPKKPGEAYGDPFHPLTPGSGAGLDYNYNSRGGHGGGAIALTVAAACRIDGILNADGNTLSNGRGGCGSGGSIFLQCATLVGSGGLVTAAGAMGANQSGGGGGGRIAVITTDKVAQATLPTPTITFSANRGVSLHYEDAELGTLYLTSKALINPYNYNHSGRLIFPGTTSYEFDSLTIEDAVVQFGLEAGDLLVEKNVTISGSKSTLFIKPETKLAIGGNFTVNDGTTLHLQANSTNFNHVTIGGDFALAAGSVAAAPTTMWVLCQSTNYPTANTSLQFDIKGAMSIATNATLLLFSASQNGGSALFRPASLHVAAGGEINSDGGGYNYTSGGPGGGKKISERFIGGGYGGLGGYGIIDGAGTTYGSEQYPRTPGSAGSIRVASGHAIKPAMRNKALKNGHGGGLIRIETPGTAHIDGLLSANGGNAYRGGGGSGGGIYIHCRRFAGGTSALLSANGGDYTYATAPELAGGGGGGRIAIWRISHSYEGSYSVLGGTSTVDAPEAQGSPGTVFLGDLPQTGTLVILK